MNGEKWTDSRVAWLRKTEIVQITLASAAAWLILVSGCSDPVEPPVSWDRAMSRAATEENLRALSDGAIHDRGDVVEVLNALAHLRESWTFVNQLVNVEETSFLAFCDLENYSYATAPYPSKLTLLEVIEMDSIVESRMEELRAVRARACSNYAALLGNRLLEVSATLPLPNGSGGVHSWVPATFDITNNSARALSEFALSWVIQVKGRQTAISRGHLYIKVIGGLEPGESVTRSFGRSSAREAGFDKDDYDAIREAIDVFGQDHLHIDACVNVFGRGDSRDCLRFEWHFQDSFKELNQKALELHLIQSKFYSDQINSKSSLST